LQRQILCSLAGCRYLAASERFGDTSVSDQSYGSGRKGYEPRSERDWGASCFSWDADAIRSKVMRRVSQRRFGGSVRAWECSTSRAEL